MRVQDMTPQQVSDFFDSLQGMTDAELLELLDRDGLDFAAHAAVVDELDAR